MSNELPAVTIIGVGNPMRRDDGVGPAAIDRLAAIDLGPVYVELITLDGEPARLIEAWRNRRRVIVVDAVCSGAPAGSIHRLEYGADPLPESKTNCSSHGGGIAEAIALAQALDAMPEQLVLIGTESGDLSLGEGLTDEVLAALPMLVEKIAAEATA